jgi:hypothetical protein
MAAFSKSLFQGLVNSPLRQTLLVILLNVEKFSAVFKKAAVNFYKYSLTRTLFQSVSLIRIQWTDSKVLVKMRNLQ